MGIQKRAERQHTKNRQTHKREEVRQRREEERRRELGVNEWAHRVLMTSEESSLLMVCLCSCTGKTAKTSQAGSRSQASPTLLAVKQQLGSTGRPSARVASQVLDVRVSGWFTMAA